MTDTLAKLLPVSPLVRAECGAEGRELLILLPAYSATKVVQEHFTTLFPAEDGTFGSMLHTKTAMKGKLKTYPLGDLLVHQPVALSSNANSLNFLRGWVLAAAIHALANGDAKHTAWQFAVRAVRHLCVGPSWSQERFRIPMLDGLSLGKVRRSLDAWAAREQASGNSHANQIQNIRRALDHLAGVERRHIDAGTRKQTDRSREFAKEIGSSQTKISGSRIQLLIDCDEHDHRQEPFHSVEEAADVARVRSLCSEQADLDDVIEELAEEDASDLAMTASRNITQAEAKVIARDLHSAVVKGAQPGVALLAASLALGTSLKELMALPQQLPDAAGSSWWRVSGQKIGVAYAPAVTKAPKPPNGACAIMLPDWLGAAVIAALGCDLEASALETQARQWLAGQPGRTQRLSRIAQCLPIALRSAGTDAAIAGFLCRRDVRTCPQMYYTRLTGFQLEQNYAAYQRDWLANTFNDIQIIELVPRKGTIGSRRVPDLSAVQKMFQSLKAQLNEVSVDLEDRRPNAVAEYHGAFINNVTGIFAIATGARPHFEASPSFSQMQLAGPFPQIHLRDKGNRVVDDARWLPVPAVLQDALQQLRLHLEYLRPWAAMTSPLLVKQIDLSLSGECCPLWYIPNGDKALEPLTAAKFWKTHRPARQERNLFRHFWRTEFVRANFPGWMVDYWMGHGGWKSAQYLPNATYRPGDLLPIRLFIDHTVTSLGLTVPAAQRMPR